MGAVHVTIDLENTNDADNAEAGLVPPGSIRRYSTRSLVDTGAVMLVLPEDVVDHLGLKRRGKTVVSFADERKVDWDLAGPVTVRVGKRQGIFECLVGPPTSEPLFGQILLERLDLLVDRLHQQLTVRPESPLLPMLSVKESREDQGRMTGLCEPTPSRTPTRVTGSRHSTAPPRPAERDGRPVRLDDLLRHREPLPPHDDHAQHRPGPLPVEAQGLRVQYRFTERWFSLTLRRAAIGEAQPSKV